MGAAWRSPKPKQFAEFLTMIRGVRALGLETCATLGMLTDEQAANLKAAGLDYYNHNLDTSERHYPQVITTRTYRDRLDTLQAVRAAGLKVHRAGSGLARNCRPGGARTLATLPEHPESAHQPTGAGACTPQHALPRDPLDFVRDRAGPHSHAGFARALVGRRADERRMQALCFFAGANPFPGPSDR
jgi:biotin synthase